MHHASFSGPRPRALLRRSCRAGFAVAAAASAIFAASTSVAQTAPPLGYRSSTWPPPRSASRLDAPAPRSLDAVTTTPKSEESMSFDLGCATEVPLMIGAQATLELPYRFLVQGEVGVLPAAYLNVIDGVLTSAGAYDATASDLVRTSLQGSLVVRASAGLRPFSDHGLEIMGGYTLASIDGSVSARRVLETFSGVAVPAAITDTQIQLNTTIHSLHVSLGWRWVVADHFVVRAQLAYLQSVGSSSSLAVPASVAALPGVAARVDQVSQTVDTTLNDNYMKYAKLPVIGLSLGYRF
jgi:hypothetical protein